MSNDDHTFSAMLTLLAGGAAGYAAGRWIVQPWLATRTDHHGTNAAARRSLSTGPVDPYAGPSGAMQPIDPYADTPVVAAAPVVVTIPPVAVPTEVKPTAPRIDGPILSPTAVAPAPAPSVTVNPIASQADGPITSPSQVDGPITSPTQVAIATSPALSSPSSGGRFATAARVRRFDPIFERYRGSLPLAYVRALVERESDGHPGVRTSSAVGLMQIVPVVLADYNRRHGTAYQSAQLVDPATNVAIGCELLRLIATSYRKNHPRIPNLQPDWNNARFVELLTFGWNAGFSEAGGVGRVARYLEKLGAVDITLDQISAHARLAGASKHLSNSAKVVWCKSVVALYLRERALIDAPATLVA